MNDLLKAYKYRIYPNKEQEVFFAKCFGCARFVYNKMLADRISDYNQKKSLKDVELKKLKYPTPASYKKEFPFLKEVDSLALANEQMDLNQAYRNFFRDKSVGFPKFKSKKNNRSTYSTNNQKGTIFIEKGYIKLPKLKSKVKIVQHRSFRGIIKSSTISRTPTGKYFISILVETEIKKLAKTLKKVGVDVGIKDFAITSSGEVFSNPKWFRRSEKRLAKLQRSLSKKKLGSKNRHKARLKVALLHEKIANQRKDFIHKVSHKLINENQVIVIEDLRIKNMLKDRKLSKAISEVSWFEFRRQLEYKALWYGRTLVVAPSNYASSQLCSSCGNKSSQTKDLSCRTYKCLKCGLVLDRDINAGKNLLKLSL